MEDVMDNKTPKQIESAIYALRMDRQYLSHRANEGEYDSLFRLMSPVPTIYWTSPGSAPSMYHRAGFDDLVHNNKRRKDRTILKGRYQGGSVGYVEAGDLELFAAIYRKKIERLSPLQREIVDIIEREGPMTINYIKEITGYLTKEITPQMQKLQEAYIVYEEQHESGDERYWYLFEDEFRDANLEQYTYAQALKEVLLRFAEVLPFYEAKQAKSFYKLPQKDINAALAELIKDGALLYENGYALPADVSLIRGSAVIPDKSVFVLHRSDFLARADEYWIKDEFKHETYGLLHYLLIDGRFAGAVHGRFTFGPPEIEDVTLSLSQSETEARKDEILEAVNLIHDREGSPVKRYCGAEL